MKTAEQTILKFVRFVDLNGWSANSSIFEDIKSYYPLVPLFKVLKRVKEPTTVEDEKLYERITVRLYGKGVLKRDELYGRDIGTKKQFIAREGQLIVSRIDARNGAFGIVPKELDGAIVTNDFWLFDVQNALPQYLMLILSSDYFQQYWRTKSSGTTNRQRVNENSFLTSKIALPTVDVQRELLQKYNVKVALSQSQEKEICNLQHRISEYLLEEMHISFKGTSFNGLIGTVNYKNITRWDPQFLLNNVSMISSEKLIPMADVIFNFMVDASGKSLRINTQDDEESSFLYIGMENIEKNSGKASPKAVLGKDILSQTVRVPSNYVIYGKLRPYLNKYWENKDSLNNVICSSEFFVFDTKNINRQFFIEILSSQIIQKQLPFLYSGARMPRISERDFMELKIPIPSDEKQGRVVEYIMNLRDRIINLEEQIVTGVNMAKKEFEEAIFSEI